MQFACKMHELFLDGYCTVFHPYKPLWRRNYYNTHLNTYTNTHIIPSNRSSLNLPFFTYSRFMVNFKPHSTLYTVKMTLLNNVRTNLSVIIIKVLYRYSKNAVPIFSFFSKYDLFLNHKILSEATPLHKVKAYRAHCVYASISCLQSCSVFNLRNEFWRTWHWMGVYI
jgi:hypothetical protein